MKTVRITLAGALLRVQVPESLEEFRIGLGGRDAIGTDGMLFPGVTSVWMGPMRFPLDIVFLGKGENGEWIVRGVSHNAPAGSRDTLSCAGCTDVLELPAGWAAKHGLTVGDAVWLSR